MKSIIFKNNFLKFEFVIDDNNLVKLTYLGNQVNYINKPSTLVEIETNDGDHLGSHCFKQCNTPFGKNAKYVCHVIEDNELILTLSDSILSVDVHIKLYDLVSGFSVCNVVKNVSNKEINLEYISSLYLYGIGQISNPTCKDMNVYYASNSWNTEAQVKKESFVDANIFNGNNRMTMKKFVLNNAGSWSSKEYLPLIGIENIMKKQFILCQVENNGSWHIELGDNENQYYLSVCGPEMSDNQWCLNLKPGNTFRSVSASCVLASDYETAVQELTKLRRNIIDKAHVDYVTQPIIFNDFMHGTWDRSNEELIKPLIDASAEVGIDCFVVDAGWFSKTTGWGNYIGDYVEASENYPNGGLGGLFDYMRSKGLKVGLWFEIENVGSLSNTANELPEECFIHINGNRIMRNSRYCLNFNNAKAYGWALNKISSAVKKYNLDYIKIDYNLDLGVGGDDECSFLGVELLNHNRKVIDFIRDLHIQFPNLIIENCASGGQRLDYEMLKCTQLASTSDLENYCLYPNITGNIYLATLPEQAGIWSYPVCNDNEKFDITDEVVIFNMVNGLAGRVTLASKINLLTNEQTDFVKEGIALAKSLTEFRKTSLPIYPNGHTRFYEPNVIFGLINEFKGILFVFNTTDTKQNITIDLNKYKAKNVKIKYPLKKHIHYLFKDGVLDVSFEQGYMARIFEFEVK